MIYFLITGLAAGIDLFIKAGIDRMPDSSLPRDLKGTKGRVELKKLRNPGFPLGTLSSFPRIVKAVPLFMTSLILGRLSLLLPRKGHIAEKTGLALTAGGSLSNVYDRFFRSSVVDYIHVKKGFLSHIIFNLGDLFIAAGGVWLVVAGLLKKEETQ